MSRVEPDAQPAELAAVFAALGDPMRLELVSRLSDGRSHSISDLSDGLPVTRQAVRKHLHVLHAAQIVTGERVGREHQFSIKPAGFAAARDYLERVSEQWDDAIGRLSSFLDADEGRD